MAKKKEVKKESEVLVKNEQSIDWAEFEKEE